MSSDDKQQAEKDAVTIGQIRRRYERCLEAEIKELNGLIRQGYHQLHKVKSFVDEKIANTLTKLQNLDAMAGVEILFPDKEQTK